MNPVVVHLIPYPPVAWIDGQTGEIQGFDAEIIRTIANEADLPVHLETTTWEKLFFNLLEGKCDLAIAALTITDQRLETIVFSDSYLTSGQIIATPQNTKIRSIKDLSQIPTGVLANTTGEYLFAMMDEASSPSIRRFPSIIPAFTALAEGEVEAIITDQPLAAYYIKNNPELRLTTIGDIFTVEDYAIACRKDRLDLRDKINLGLQKIKANGSYQKILQKYF